MAQLSAELQESKPILLGQVSVSIAHDDEHRCAPGMMKSRLQTQPALWSSKGALERDLDGVHTSICDPDSPCNTINPDTVCCQWRTCLILADTGINATQYVNSNCTGTSNTFDVLIASAVLDYQVIGTTRRFILWVTALPGGGIPIPIFFGVANFDARQCANYATWPLMITNGLSSTGCICGGSGTAMHPAATGGTATLTMACDTDCSGLEPGLGLESLEAPGPRIAAHRIVDAAALDLADAREERRRGCTGCRKRRATARLRCIQFPAR
ncbi:MAG: hypothetical protein IT430_04365 [Phycisphaerales bacterium]|nr:hypothetical protein [Phycisphaerales bacterium]